MPRYKGTCGCYNRDDARELGLVAAVVWNDMLDRSEHFDVNPFWYDQRRAAERLGIPYQTISRAIATLVEHKRITSRAGYRPNTTIKTTWITILTEDVDDPQSDLGEHQKSQNEISKKSQNEISILNETKEDDTDSKEVPNGQLGGTRNVPFKPSAIYTPITSIFKKAGYTIGMRKRITEKIESLVASFSDYEDEVTIGAIKDAALAYIESDWDNKCIENFLSPNVFACFFGKKQPSKGKENANGRKNYYIDQ